MENEVRGEDDNEKEDENTTQWAPRDTRRNSRGEWSPSENLDLIYFYSLS